MDSEPESQLPTIDRDALFARLGQQVPEREPARVVLCSSARYAQFLHESFAQFQVARGVEVWATPSLLTPEQFLADCAGRAHRHPQAGGTSLPVALSTAESDLLWRLVVMADRSESPLLRDAEAATLASAAWALCHDYDIALPLSSPSPDGERFNGWAASYRARCEALGQPDAQMFRERLLGQLAAGTLPLPSAVVFAGFDVPPPWVQRLAAALIEAGCEVSRLSVPPIAARVRAVSTRTPEQELRAAAAWVLQTAKQQSGARIGVVVPDLASRREDLLRVFDQTLCPTLDTTKAERPYNLSLGVALADGERVHCALLLIRLMVGELDHASVCALLCDPHWGAGEAEWQERAALDLRVRDEGFLRVDLTTLLRLAPANSATRARLQSLATLRGARSSADVSEWVERFTAWLDAAGWPGAQSLSSHEFQQLDAWRGLLRSFGSLSAVLGRVPGSGALEQLQRLAQQRVFQPQSGPARIQVLGALEAQGLTFDALWVVGLDDEHWPPVGRPNPFIPFALQRQQQLPHSCAAQELEWAQRMTQRWRESAGEVTFSWAREADDHPLSPSPLILAEAQQATEVDLDALAPAWRLAAASGHLEARADAYAPPPALTVPVPGGSRLLGDQARCPFRAYARHRLGAQPLETPGYGPTNADRGKLVHQCLERLWRDIRDHAGLIALSDAVLADRIAEAVTHELEVLAAQAPQRLPAGLLALEAGRLRALLQDWFAIERARPSFRAVLLEGSAPELDAAAPLADQEVSFAGLRLRLRADRVDELEDGSRMVVDYKTGARKPLPWHDGRPEEPQLLLYALTTPRVAALAYARLNARALGFQGLGAEEGMTEGVAAYSKDKATRDASSWDGLLGRWRGELETLALEVRRGLASVTPKHVRTACRDCHLHAVCRIHEVQPAFLSDDDSGDAPAVGGDA